MRLICFTGYSISGTHEPLAPAIDDLRSEFEGIGLGDDGASAAHHDRIWQTRDEYQRHAENYLPQNPAAVDIFEILPHALAPVSPPSNSEHTHRLASTRDGRSSTREWLTVLSAVEKDINDVLESLPSSLASVPPLSHETLATLETRIRICEVSLSEIPRSSASSVLKRKDVVLSILMEVETRLQRWRSIVKTPDADIREYDSGKSSNSSLASA